MTYSGQIIYHYLNKTFSYVGLVGNDKLVANATDHMAPVAVAGVCNALSRSELKVLTVGRVRTMERRTPNVAYGHVYIIYH